MFFKSNNFLTVLFWMLFFILTLSGSLGQIARWDFLDQIAMSDNFILRGTMYPSVADP